ncbi:hypothetical protein, partial [Klebsiella pneumoniae]|uniref:hypothetical protein n=1 Tax=Klebsiella pneumoniae TaxID=573 RepID=UPI000D88073B
WLIRLLILGSGYNTMISHLGLIRTFLSLWLKSAEKPTELLTGKKRFTPHKININGATIR